ncbi:MAG TPA: HAMP domain-containing sensor histidine kinase [Gemmatimonadaceae bacterium]|nr:HAMP domain-containing sensor histidine kinase [Gemmatimonadaceae bacterium]
MTLRARLTLGFLAIAAILVIPLGISLWALATVQDATAQLQERNVAPSIDLGRAIRALEVVRKQEQIYPIFPEDTTGPAIRMALDSLETAVDSLSPYDLQAESSRLKREVESIRSALPALRAAADVNDTLAIDSISQFRTQPSIQRAESLLVTVREQLEASSRDLVYMAAAEATDAYQTALSALALAVLLAAGVAIQIARSISRPVRELERGMDAVAGGNFDRPLAIAPSRDDEFGRLAQSYHTMAQQLADLDRMKAEFVSVASHELKTPINVILGYLQLLDEGVYGTLTPRQRDVLATLATQGQSLARLVQQLLDISRFEAGGGKLEPHEMELAPFIAELESAFHVLAHQRGVNFHVLRGEDLPTTVKWDNDRMNEVVGNLLSNAFKFTDRGGQVDLEVTRAAENVQLVVRDTGAGIPTSQLPHVFRKFYQADNQSAATIKGTGLGLAIAKEIVEAHGGRITVDSTPGVGTSFCIVLPVRTPVRRPSGPHAAVPVEQVAP